MALEFYGNTAAGERVDSFTLRNDNGMEVRGISYGCRLTHLLVPDPDGGKADILLGFDDLAGYEADTMSHGALVGRYANRIENATFSLNGNTVRLTPGEGSHFLHGSFAYKVFHAEMVGDNSVSLTYTSPDGEDGFPGEVWVGVMLTLTEKNELVMDYRAVSTADTHLNLTNHNYYNLAGAGSGDIGQQMLWLNSATVLEPRPDLIPTGRTLPVDGGVFDFREEKPIGRDMDMEGDPQIKMMGGYNHTFPLEKGRNGALTMSAIARDPDSGRTLRVYTTQPAVHLYTGNDLSTDVKGKGGAPMAPHSAFCLETQHYPNSPNQPEFPSTLLEVGDKYHHITVLLLEW